MIFQNRSGSAFQAKVDEARESMDKQLEALPPDALDHDVCITCRFKAEDMIVVHLLTQELPDVPVIFLDTGNYSAQIYEYRDQLARDGVLNLVNLHTELITAERDPQIRLSGQTAPSMNGDLWKATTLLAALENYLLWFTGFRKEQSTIGARFKCVEDFVLPTGKHLRKVRPLIKWTSNDVWQYAGLHGIPLLPLYDKISAIMEPEPSTVCLSTPTTSAPATESGNVSGMPKPRSSR